MHTGQHHDANMSDVFFEEMDIPRPDYNLGIAGGSHGSMTGKMLIAIEEILLKEKPDALLAYGDTNSTMAAAFSGKPSSPGKNVSLCWTLRSGRRPCGTGGMYWRNHVARIS